MVRADPPAPGSPAADRQDGPTVASVVIGIFIGAIALAIAGALVWGFGMWLWAVTADNQETNTEAPGWFLVGMILGAIVFAPLGAIFGLMQRLRRAPLRHWVLPVVGLVLGCLLWLATIRDSPTIGFYSVPLGLVGGLIANLLFQLGVEGWRGPAGTTHPAAPLPPAPTEQAPPAHY